MHRKKLYAVLIVTGLVVCTLEIAARYNNAAVYYDDSYDDNYGYDDECYEILKERYVTYRSDRGGRVAAGALGGAASGALIGGIAGGGRGAGIGAGVGAGLGIIGGASSGRGRVRVLRQTCRSRDGRVFTREIPVN